MYSSHRSLVICFGLLVSFACSSRESDNARGGGGSAGEETAVGRGGGMKPAATAGAAGGDTQPASGGMAASAGSQDTETPDGRGGSVEFGGGGSMAELGGTTGASGEGGAGDVCPPCSGTTPICDVESSTCKTCTETVGCSGGTPFCDEAGNNGAGECVGCLVGTDCAADSACDYGTQECRPV